MRRLEPRTESDAYVSQMPPIFLFPGLTGKTGSTARPCRGSLLFELGCDEKGKGCKPLCCNRIQIRTGKRSCELRTCVEPRDARRTAGQCLSRSAPGSGPTIARKR